MPLYDIRGYTPSDERPSISVQAVEERLLRELGSRRRELGESLRHQRAAAREVAVFNWRVKADDFVWKHAGLDAADPRDALAYEHAVYVLAGQYRETVEQAIAECERDFLATREAGQ